MANKRAGAPADDLTHVEFETSENVEVLSTFDTMHLHEDLIRGIYSYGKLHGHQNLVFLTLPVM